MACKPKFKGSGTMPPDDQLTQVWGELEVSKIETAELRKQLSCLRHRAEVAEMALVLYSAEVGANVALTSGDNPLIRLAEINDAVLRVARADAELEVLMDEAVRAAATESSKVGDADG